MTKNDMVAVGSIETIGSGAGTVFLGALMLVA
jgi:hypothetical protein